MPIPAGSTPPPSPSTGPLVYDPVLSRVRLSASGLFDGALVRVERSVDQVRWTAVRGGELFPLGGEVSVSDYEFAAGVPNWYRIIGPAVWDGFDRSVSGSWDTAPSGQVWTTTGGSGSDYSVSGTAGLQSMGTVNALRHSLIDIGSTDGTYTQDFTNPVVPTGAPITHWVAGRATDTGNYYYARLDIAVGGAATIILAKRAAGATSGLTAALPAGTHTAGATWRVTLDWHGTELAAKAWKPATDSEPEWQVTATDSTLTAGTLAGPLTRLEAGNTNTLPVVVSYDNVVVTSPETTLYTGSIVPLLGGVWLKNLARPFLNREVVVRGFGDVTRPSRSGIHDVVGRSDPVAVTDVRGSRQWQLLLNTYNQEEADDLDLLLASGDILLVQVPPNAGRISAVPGGYVTVGDTREVTLPTADLASRVFELPCKVVAAPGPDVVGATSNWQTVLNTYATWADLLAAHPSWASVLELIGDPEDVIVS